jgi:predicted nuclease with TOPRIM domain
MVLVLVVASFFVGCENKAQMEEVKRLTEENLALQEQVAQGEQTIKDLQAKIDELTKIEAPAEGTDAKPAVVKEKKEEPKETPKAAGDETKKKVKK